MDELKTNDKNDNEKDKQFSDEVTKRKIEKHLTDMNDEISEEDIKNINTDHRPGKLPRNKTEESKKVEDNTIEATNDDEIKKDDRKANTSYDILEP